MKLLRYALAALLAFAPMSAAFATDNVAVTAGSGKTIACKEISTTCYPEHMIADHLGNLIDPATSGNQSTEITSLGSIDTKLTSQATGAKQDTGNTSMASIDGKIVAPFAGVATTTITRPADTTAYAANDILADSTSAPTAGGFTLNNVCSASGKSGVINSVAIVSSNDPATTLIGEIWIFDSAVTAVNDNAAMALSDADALKLVGKIPFALETSQAGSGANSIYASGGLSLGYTCSGSANLRYLVKVKNAYTPASAETLALRVNFVGLN
ncbi:MAG: hypothetical protein JF588_11535 [Caulobacterales bacterium]|nr:hypothetical protein [Caulobacterales bacterium]